MINDDNNIADFPSLPKLQPEKFNLKFPWAVKFIAQLSDFLRFIKFVVPGTIVAT